MSRNASRRLVVVLSVCVLLVGSGLVRAAARTAPGPLQVLVKSAGDGKPRAEVRLQTGARSVTTGGDGLGVFDGLPAGPRRLVIAEPGFDRLEKALDLPAGRRERVEVSLRPTETVALTGLVGVAGSKAPLAGAHIVLAPTAVPAALQGAYRFMSDWDGRFLVREIPCGRYRATVSAEGCKTQTFDAEIRRATEKGPQKLQFLLPALEDRASLRVTVTDQATGRAVAGAKVTLSECGPAGTIATGASGADGVASFGDLKVARLNWPDVRGALAASRSAVTVRVEAEGCEPVVAVAALAPGAKLAVTLQPIVPIAEKEPNDTQAAAQWVRTNCPVSLTFHKAGDRDCFRFRIPWPGRVRIGLASKGVHETVLTLLSRDAKDLRVQYVRVDRDNSFDMDLGAGEYTVRVGELNDDQAGTKPMMLTIGYEPVVDVFEPNAAASAARLIRSGEEVRGCIFPVGDRDYYRFEVKRPSWVRFTMPKHPLGHAVLLYDRKGGQRAQTYVREDNATMLSAQVAPGAYVVGVSEWNDNGCSRTPYCLRFEQIEDDGIDDPAESAGRLSAARSMPVNALAAATIFPAGDVDRWSVSVPSGGLLVARIVAAGHRGLFIRDRTGRQLASAWVRAGRAGECAWQAMGPETVFVEVREWNNGNASVSPCVVSTRWVTCDENDLLDRNETADAATPLALNETMRCTILPTGDTDFYRFTVDHPGWLSLAGPTPIALHVRVLDLRGALVDQQYVPADRSVSMRMPVLSGDYFVAVREWNNRAISACPYAITPVLERAEPVERAPLRSDPVRALTLGEARPLRLEHAGDLDRFLLSVPRAMKFSIQWWTPMGTHVSVFDDRTGQRLHNRFVARGRPGRADLESRGATRYRIEVEELGANEGTLGEGYLFADEAGRPIVAETIEAKTDPFVPTRVTFTRRELKPLKRAARVRIDADGDGKVDLELPAGKSAAWDYRSEGVYAATVWFDGADGVSTRSYVWVEATGPREREGLYVAVNYPAEGQVIERDRDCRATAVSYSGARIARMTLAVDGRDVAPAHFVPFEFRVPWRRLGAGEHKLVFTAVDGRGVQKSVTRTVRMSDYFDLLPEDGAVLTGRSVRVSWRGTAFGPARVRYRRAGEKDWQEVVGENGRARTVTLGALESGKPYEVQPLGGGEPGPVRRITWAKGLAFGRAKYSGTIQRDYDQRLGVSVRNDGEKPRTVRLACGNPPEASRLLVGFVGEGSKGAPITLKSGEEREFMLGLSAQDCVSPTVKFPIRLVSATGISDVADVEVNVKLPVVKLEWQRIGPAPEGIAELWRLHNRGDALTDLDVYTSSLDVAISSAVRHGVLAAGAHIDFTVTPRLFEGFQKAEGRLLADAVGKQSGAAFSIGLKEGQAIYGVQLVPGQGAGEDADLLAARALAGAWLDPSKVDWTQKRMPEDTDGDGRPDRWRVEDAAQDILWLGDDTDGDGQIDFVHADVGCDGQFDYSAFKTKDAWEETNLVEAWLELGFSLPWARSTYEKHDVDVVLNDRVVGTLRDALPEGNYTFRLPPTALKFDAQGRAAGNAVGIKSKHLRGGHYVVTSDFRISLRLTGTRVWVAATSKQEAEKAAGKIQGLSLSGPDYSFSSAEMTVETPQGLRKGVDLIVCASLRNVGATRTGNVTVALVRAVPGGKGAEVARITLPGVPLTGAASVRIPWRAAAGVHQLRLVADPDHETADAQRTNDTAMVTVTVPGDDAKPVIEPLEPADGANFKQTVGGLRARGTDDSGVARVEARIDGGLWVALGGETVFTGKCLMQPGSHTVTFRVTDGSANQVEKAVKVTVEATPPELAILVPAEGGAIDARTVTVRIKAGDGAVLAGARSGGGPWRRVALKDGLGEVDVPLTFGRTSIEAMAADKAGAVRVSRIAVNCTRQPAPDAAPAVVPGSGDGLVTIEGLGVVNLFGPQSTIVGAAPDGAAPNAGRPPAPRPEALQKGRRAIYRCVSGEQYITAEFTAEGVTMRCTPAGAKEALVLTGLLAAAASGGDVFCGEAACEQVSAREPVRYAFDRTGRSLTVVWPDADAGPGMFWYEVREVGSAEPVVAAPVEKGGAK